MHDIQAIDAKIDVPLTYFVKALYPTYSHYLETLQASGKLKEIFFDSLMEKFTKRDNDFEKKKAHAQYSEEVV